MTETRFTEAELDLLMETLEGRLNDLRREIAGTESAEYRQMLITRSAMLSRILRGLSFDRRRGFEVRGEMTRRPPMIHDPALFLNGLHERKLVHGPKRSRRLGHSLAVDIIPRKACPLDCIYCEIGRTNHLTNIREAFIDPDTVGNQLRSFLHSYKGRIDHITVSASGEPTLNSQIGEIIGCIKGISPVPVAVLTNGIMLNRGEVRRDLLEADVVLPSLDAVSEPVFHLVNRPHGSESAANLIRGLIAFRSEYTGQIWLEILLVKGFNDSAEELERLKQAVAKIQPDKIHLNTVVRAPAEPGAMPADEAVMRGFCATLGPRCTVL